MRRLATLAALAALSLGARPLAEPPVTLRFAAIAPEGSAWARPLKEMQREVAAGTQGRVAVHWLLGGVAGDEVVSLGRLERGELDGLAGAILCQRVAPSLRVLEVAGLVQTDDEAAEVIRWIRPRVDQEFEHTPFVLLALSTGFGHRAVFSREPVRTLEELRQHPFWVYDLDEVERAQLSLMGLKLRPQSIPHGARAFDEGAVDGFVSVPGAALLWGFSARTHYFTDLPGGSVAGCLVISRRSFAKLSPSDQELLRRAAERLNVRFSRVGNQMDAELLDHGFARQGLTGVPLSASFRRQWLEAAMAAREKLGPRLVPRQLVQEVAGVLERHRARASSGSAEDPAERPP
jgi:TRAP-type C4-dicarboxylate transport system substrate-binding protein